jgi:phospholipase D
MKRAFPSSCRYQDNKTMVIDSNIVITGSYNFTNAANFRNAENVNFIYDTQIAKHYLNNWKDRFEAARD